MLKPLWTFGQIEQDIRAFVDEKEQKTIQVLSYVGETFLNDYRESGSYRDQTGNLRASGGYFVKKGNETVESDTGSTSTGKQAAIDTANAVNVKSGELALIGTAGMEYAESVEARGRDVITPMAQRAGLELEKLLKQI
jgi:hypothetical protein